jgi:hypothetical protein
VQGGSQCGFYGPGRGGAGVPEPGSDLAGVEPLAGAAASPRNPLAHSGVYLAVTPRPYGVRPDTDQTVRYPAHQEAFQVTWASAAWPLGLGWK